MVTGILGGWTTQDTHISSSIFQIHKSRLKSIRSTFSVPSGPNSGPKEAPTGEVGRNWGPLVFEDWLFMWEYDMTALYSAGKNGKRKWKNMKGHKSWNVGDVLWQFVFFYKSLYSQLLKCHAKKKQRHWQSFLVWSSSQHFWMESFRWPNAYPSNWNGGGVPPISSCLDVFFGPHFNEKTGGFSRKMTQRLFPKLDPPINSEEVPFVRGPQNVWAFKESRWLLVDMAIFGINSLDCWGVHRPETIETWSMMLEALNRLKRMMGFTSPYGSSHILSWWLGCTITSLGRYLGSITILRRWLDA